MADRSSASSAVAVVLPTVSNQLQQAHDVAAAFAYGHAKLPRELAAFTHGHAKLQRTTNIPVTRAADIAYPHIDPGANARSRG